VCGCPANEEDFVARIEIVPYNPGWVDDFREIGSALREALGPLAVRIDHIGSTSVPGLAAKDVIDLQVTVAELDRAAIEAAVTPIGYGLRADVAWDHIPAGETEDPAEWTKLFLITRAGQRRTHVHIRQAGRRNQRYPLLFRDYLRAHPAAAESYRLIKVALARLHPDDMDAYYDVKDPVCDLIMDSAETWAVQSGWQQGASDL
jgi:GrpB-like predicted nucleotidyltransferase (UPF0157 family)